MKINPYLNFNGNCEEAFRFYEKLLGGTIESISKYEDMPDQGVHQEMRGKVLHVRLNVDGQIIFGSDSPTEHYSKPQGTYVSINVDKPAEGKRIFDALSQNGSVHMAYEKTFWAAGGFGMAADRFGTLWMVNCEKGD